MNSFTNRLSVRIATLAVMTLAIFSLLVSAEKKASAAKKAKQDEMGKRAIILKSYKEKSVEGLVVKLLDRKGNPVNPGGNFKAGDELKISLISNFGGYVYFVNITPGGKTRVFWNTRVNADEEAILPTGKDVISFDNEKGTETFKVVLSVEKIDDYENAMRNSDGWLGKTEESVAAELGVQPKTDPEKNKSKDKGKDKDKDKSKPETVGIVQPQTEAKMTCRGLGFDPDPKIRCRGLGFAPENNNSNATVVAIADKQGKMKKSDIAVFELHLKHI